MRKAKKISEGDLKGVTGEYCEISKDELYVDESYQRSKWNEKRVARIAKQWTWVQCGALTVAIRENRWWVIDGATRKQAADKRNDIDELPCLVFDLDNSVASEAGSFVAINTDKVMVTTPDRFRALLVSGDKCAVALNLLFEATGHKAGSSSGVKIVSCIRTVWKLFKRSPDTFQRFWQFIADIHSDSQIKDSVARGLYYAEEHLNRNKLSLMTPPYRSILMSTGGEGLYKTIKSEKDALQRSGIRTEVNAILNFVNKAKQRSIKKLPIMITE